MPPPVTTGPRPIPLTVIGGFLGAGKTTLVNAVLAQAQGRRVAILVNDFGALSIDAALISARSAQTIALVNGCVCCSLVNGLTQALIDVLRLQPPPDHVLVEASGVSDPRRIAQIARADPAFVQDVTLVLAAADQIAALARDRYVGDTVQRQLAGADIVVLNKIDLVGGGEADAICAWLRGVAPDARVLRAVDAGVPCDVVLGPLPIPAREVALHARVPCAREAASLFDVVPDPPGIQAGNGSANEPGGARYTARGSDHATRFATRTLRCAHPVSETALRRALDSIPAAVLRAKGIVYFDTAPRTPQLIQVVGRRRTIVPAPPEAAFAECVLVLVAAAGALADCDLDALTALFA